VFILKKAYGEEKKEEKIKAQWTETLGEERILEISHPKACVDVMLGAIALTSGTRDLNGYIHDMKERGQDNERIEEVVKSLTNFNRKMVNFRNQNILNPNSNQMINNNQQNNSNININISSNINQVKVNEIKSNMDEIFRKNYSDQDKLQYRENLLKLQQSLDNVPEELLCPITGVIFLDPVMTSDGQTYERSAISRWLENHDTSPTTNSKLDNKNLITNFVIKQLVKSYYDDNAKKIK